MIDRISVMTERNDRLTSQKSIEILKKAGIEISSEEVEKVIEFMYELANLAINKYLDDEDCKFIHPGKYRRTGR